jgi:hypothetical protein
VENTLIFINKIINFLKMKKLNGFVLYFILIIYLLNCSNAEKNFNKLENFNENEAKTNTEIETNKKSENFLTNQLFMKMCGNKEGRINLISFNSQKKLIANPVYMIFDSKNFNFFNINKKSLIIHFKTFDLKSVNKIPIVKPLPEKETKNCFELLFENTRSDDEESTIKMKMIPITLCATDVDKKLSFLKEIVNTKQCQLNKFDKLTKGIDRTKVFKNLNVVQKLLKERKKNMEKLKVSDNFSCCAKNATKIDNINEAKKDQIDPKKELLIKKLMALKIEVFNRFKKDMIFSAQRRLYETNKLKTFMKELRKKSSKDLENKFKNFIKQEKEKRLKESVEMLNSLKKIGNNNNKKGLYKMCQLSNSPNSNNGDYKDKKKNVCIMIHGFDKPKDLNQCINNDENFCMSCCSKFAENEQKRKTCERDCLEHTKKAKAEIDLFNSLRNQKKQKTKSSKGKKKKSRGSLVDDLLNNYYKNKKNKRKGKGKRRGRGSELDEIDKLIRNSRKKKTVKKVKNKKTNLLVDDLLNSYNKNKNNKDIYYINKKKKITDNSNRDKIINDLLNRAKSKKQIDDKNKNKIKDKKNTDKIINDLLNREKSKKDIDHKNKNKIKDKKNTDKIINDLLNSSKRKKKIRSKPKKKNYMDILKSLRLNQNKGKFDADRARKKSKEKQKKDYEKIIKDLENLNQRKKKKKKGNLFSIINFLKINNLKEVEIFLTIYYPIFTPKNIKQV